MMDTVYYKTIRCYIDALTRKEEVKLADLEKIIDRCPLEYIESYTSKEFRINSSKNLPTLVIDNKTHTTLAIGICYFLAKSNFSHADFLVMPLITFINSKISPKTYNDPRSSFSFQEKFCVERMHWSNFSIISSTLCSYAYYLGSSHPNFESIIRSLFYLWGRIVKTILKIMSSSRSVISRPKNSDEKQSLKILMATAFGSWYSMALTHVSIGILLALDSENLVKYILNPEKYYYFLEKSHTFDLDIPDFVINEINNLLNLNIPEIFKDKTFNYRYNIFCTPKKIQLKVLVMSGLSFLIYQIGRFSAIKENPITHSFVLSNCQKMISLIEERIKNDPIALFTTKLYSLKDIVNFENLHLDEPSLIYSRCMNDLTKLYVTLKGKKSINEVEELCETFFQVLSKTVPRKFPLARIEIFSRFPCLYGLNLIIKEYPTHINRLCIFEKLLELVQQPCDIFSHLAASTYQTHLKNINNTICAFTHEYYVAEEFAPGIQLTTTFHFFYCQNLLLQFLECLEMVIKIKIDTNSGSVIQLINTAAQIIYDAKNIEEKKIHTNDFNHITNAMISTQIISYIAARFPISGVFDTAMSIFQKSFAQPCTLLDKIIVTHMIYLLLKNQSPSNYNLIVNPFIKLIISTLSGSNSKIKEIEKLIQYPITTIINNFHILALNLNETDLKIQFMQDMIEIFIDISALSRKSSIIQKESDILQNYLYLIIRSISYVMKRLGQELDMTPKIQELFKKLWVCSIVTSGSCTKSHSVNIVEYFKEIAIFSPPLVVDHLKSYLKFNLSIRDTSLNDNDMFEIKNLLIQVLDCSNKSDISTSIMKLPGLHVLYLVAFYEQESLALEKETKNFPRIFLYLEDQAVEKDKENIMLLIDYTCEKIFMKFVDQLSLRPRGNDLDQDLIQHIGILLLKFNSDRKRVQRAADKYLSALINKFPHMLWNSLVIRIMLDFINILKITCNKIESVNYNLMCIDVPHTNLKYIIPDTKDKRYDIISNFQSRCDSLLMEATRCAPTVICSVLLDYLVENRFSFKESGTHYGIELLLTSMISCDFGTKADIDDAAMLDIRSSAIFSDTPSKSKPTKDKFDENKSRNFDGKAFISHCTFTATNRSYYIGKINGILNGQKYVIMRGKKIYPEYEVYLKTRLMEKEKFSEAELVDLVMLCTAYICVTKHFVRKLIQQLCILPVFNFTFDTIKIAIESWEWMFTSLKKSQISLLTIICSAWESTMKKKLGIFNTRLSDQTSKYFKISQSNIHTLWLKFILDRYDNIKFYSPDQTSIISIFILQNLKQLNRHKELLTQEYFDINAVSYFRLAIFGLKLLERQYVSNLVIRTELREYIFKAILIYFSVEPMWPDASSTKNILDTLIFLFKNLVNDRKWHIMEEQIQDSEVAKEGQFNTFSVSTLNNLTISKKPTSSSGTLVMRRSGNSISTSPELKIIDENDSFISKPKSLQISLSDTQSYTIRQFTSLTIDDICNLRQIIIQLCVKEIERLSTWYDPLDKSEAFSKYIKNIKTSFIDKKYKDKLLLIWQFNPAALLMFSHRFPEIQTLQKDVISIVKSRPERLIDKNEAVFYFWSADIDMVKISHSIKSLILIWDRCNISKAIEYFSPFLHSNDILTTQYAISCLKTSQLNDLLFYIPQLVQCLRYDTWSYIKEFIFWISQKNNIISHQFIWNMQTNAYIDEDSTILDHQIGQILLDMIQEIKNNFTERALTFYQREFKFFDEITHISGILKPFSKFDRKKKCQEELSKIVPEFGAYLPTNPDSIILNIDYTSGIPMQSAAKAPFLARFEVLNCGTDVVEKVNVTNDSNMLNLIKLDQSMKLKGAIFKVGDDVRQDVLALQLISLFKKIYKKHGLSLFLYPYKVVATSPGCGVIECVENAKSRDQLGKQTDVNLHQYFIQKYGNENSVAYKKARDRFTDSLAAYSVVSFLLQVKDRHNGNIMIDNDGQIIHIDFGFLFESSPGGNIGFEPHMKFTQEMLDILGGNFESSYYITFLTQTIKGYLVLRPHQNEIINLVVLMLGSNLPCFRSETIRRLKLRLGSNLTEKEAAEKFRVDAIQASALNYRTRLYDLLQKAQNEIPC